jgi:predicted ABC-type transport system involved in lysophospholipase L1 biosynthesis ATPase subunit
MKTGQLSKGDERPDESSGHFLVEKHVGFRFENFVLVNKMTVLVGNVHPLRRRDVAFKELIAVM